MHPLLSRNGSPNERTWNSKALPEIQNFFRRKNLDDTILKKIKYHAVESSLQAQAYDIVYQPIRQIRKQLAESEPCRESHCLLIEGDLDEIVGAEALRAIRGCVGASPTGEPDSSEINAAVSMPFLRYGFGYASSAFSSVERGGYRWRAWVKPPFVHEIGPGKTVAGQGVDVADSAFAETRSEENNAMPDEKPESQIEKIGYVYQARHELVHTTGKPLGWHLAWTLDGGPGLANKVSKTMVEKMDIYPALNAKLKVMRRSFNSTVQLCNI